MVKVLITIILATLLFTFSPVGVLSARGSPHVPILLYHRFGPVATDSMTVTTPTFEAHLKYLMTNGYRVIPVRELIDYYLGKSPSPHPKSVAITVDEGHKSVHTEMLPLIKNYHIPVTMFIYPSAISKASYAMTWGQLREMKETALFYFQSHTFWHPNFKKEKAKLKEAVDAGALSGGHARALAGVADADRQAALAERCVREGWSVRALERRLKPAPAKKRPAADPETAAAAERLASALGAPVEIHRRRRGGELRISFATEQELIRLFRVLVRERT